MMKTYHINCMPIRLHLLNEVAAPLSAMGLLRVLTRRHCLDIKPDMKVLDFGCGSGIIGVYCGLLGAEVTFLDLHPIAVALSLENASSYGIKAKGIVSDCFKALQEQYDYIVANPPMQPYLFQEQSKEGIYANETADDGRYVLDALISQSRHFLKKEGKAYLHCSSRQGRDKTIAMLNQYWPNAWKTIYQQDKALAKDRYAGYQDYWLKLQEMDRDLRIFQLDKKHHRFSSQINPQGNRMVIDDNHHAFIQVGQSWYEKNTMEPSQRAIAQDIPGPSVNGEWYYTSTFIELSSVEK